MSFRFLSSFKTALASISLLVLCVIAFSALAAPRLATRAYDDMDNLSRLAPPSKAHPLGTNHLGQDTYSRLLYGARLSLSIGVGVGLINIAIGTLIGLAAGFFGGRIDSVLMRFTDAMFAFPDILLAILIIGVVGPGLPSVLAALTIVGWPAVTRLVRGQVVRLKEWEFIAATRALGASNGRIVFKHLLPHLAGILLAFATVDIASVILAESALSFLGIGIQPPYPTWGRMIYEARPYIASHPMLLVYPCLMLSITVLSLNFIGDALRDKLDPRKQETRSA